MSGGELLLILVVSLLVFGPKKLPMLAEHLGKLMRQVYSLKQKLLQIWQTALNEQQLLENERKAEKADAKYHD